MRRGIAAFAACMLVTGCASITRGTDEPVTFDSDPPGAEMRSDIINICAGEGACARSADDRYSFADQIDRSNTPGPACITPCTIQVKRNAELLVTFSKPGYQPQTVRLGHAVSAAGGLCVAGNVIAGGVTGIVVDSVTGAGFDHVPNPLKVTLVPIARPQAGGPKRNEKAQAPRRDKAQ
jgi:hypothetical protein